MSVSLVSLAVRDFCAKLRANDPRILPPRDEPFEIYSYHPEAGRIEIARALGENTSVKRILLDVDDRSERFVEVLASYLRSSKHLHSVHLTGPPEDRFFLYLDAGTAARECRTRQQNISVLFRALYWSTSVTELIMDDLNLGLSDSPTAHWAFHKYMAFTMSLVTLEIGANGQVFGPEQVFAVCSGFAKNTTLREITLNDWTESCLAPVLAALETHPALQCLRLRRVESLLGLDGLLRSKNSKITKLVLVGLQPRGGRPLCFQPVMHALERNTKVTKLAIVAGNMSREHIQQLKAMLRQNTVLTDLGLSRNALGSAGLTEIASVLYRNRTIEMLNISDNGLDDVASATILRELTRRNKTIFDLCINDNPFGRDNAAVQIIADGLCDSRSLGFIDLSNCQLGDRGISTIAQSLWYAPTLRLCDNDITATGVGAMIEGGPSDYCYCNEIAGLHFAGNPMGSQGATLLSNALGTTTGEWLEWLTLDDCGIDDDGLVALVSSLERDETLDYLSLKGNHFSKSGFLALAASLPRIKVLKRIAFTWNTSFKSVLPALMEGFRENTSLLEVNIDGAEPGKWLEGIDMLCKRNRFFPLIYSSTTSHNSLNHGVWSNVLAKAARDPDVLFSVLRSKPELVQSTRVSKKRKRDD
jgi:hypothetical protein